MYRKAWMAALVVLFVAQGSTWSRAQEVNNSADGSATPSKKWSERWGQFRQDMVGDPNVVAAPSEPSTPKSIVRTAPVPSPAPAMSSPSPSVQKNSPSSIVGNNARNNKSIANDALPSLAPNNKVPSSSTTNNKSTSSALIKQPVPSTNPVPVPISKDNRDNKETTSSRRSILKENAPTATAPATDGASEPQASTMRVKEAPPAAIPPDVDSLPSVSSPPRVADRGEPKPVSILHRPNPLQEKLSAMREQVDLPNKSAGAPTEFPKTAMADAVVTKSIPVEPQSAPPVNVPEAAGNAPSKADIANAGQPSARRSVMMNRPSETETVVVPNQSPTPIAPTPVTPEVKAPLAPAPWVAATTVPSPAPAPQSVAAVPVNATPAPANTAPMTAWRKSNEAPIASSAAESPTPAPVAAVPTPAPIAVAATPSIESTEPAAPAVVVPTPTVAQTVTSPIPTPASPLRNADKTQIAPTAAAPANTLVTTRPAKEVGPPRPKLDLSLAGPREIAYGQTTVYRLSLSNAGTADAENVIIRLLPVDASDQGTSHNFGRLTAGEMKVVEVELVARQIGSVVIRAQVAADGGIQSDAKQDVQVTREAPLQITVRGPESIQFSTPTAYVIVVKNAGREPIEKAQVSANLPEGATFVSATCDGHVSSDRQKIEWPSFPIRGGAEIALEVKCQAVAAGSYRLLADVAASGDMHLSGESLIRVDSFADLRLDVIDPQGPMVVGQEGVYEIHLVNRGNKAAEKVDIRALFSRGIDPVEASGATYQFGDGSVNFSVIPRLEPGKELVLKVKAVAKQPGQHIFRVEAETPDTEQKLAWEQSKRYSGEVAATPSRTANERTARRVQPGEPTPASPK